MRAAGRAHVPGWCGLKCGDPESASGLNSRLEGPYDPGHLLRALKSFGTSSACTPVAGNFQLRRESSGAAQCVGSLECDRELSLTR